MNASVKKTSAFLTIAVAGALALSACGGSNNASAGPKPLPFLPDCQRLEAGTPQANEGISPAPCNHIKRRAES